MSFSEKRLNRNQVKFTRSKHLHFCLIHNIREQCMEEVFTQDVSSGGGS